MKELAILKSEVVGAICSGIRQADREYGKWTGDEGIDNAPEYLMTCAIARELVKLGKGYYATLEASVRGTLKCARIPGENRDSEGISKKGRADIVLWVAPDGSDEGLPRSVIEVKKRVMKPNEQFEKDVRRLKAVMTQSMAKVGTLDFGCLAFWMGVDVTPAAGDSYAEEKLTAASNDLLKSAKGVLGKGRLVARLERPKLHWGRYEDGTSYAWAPCVLVIEKPAA
ncbi:hypothetical protein O166_09880 [Pseudogulbenkiania ferrooxidans EGD-HP2]|uniref:Restriction endonuclease n=2 Tax=Pseudogulbenkiania ferrooxidans TaxID=549169 RepID=A0ABP2XL25_9NEIS|nr:hypothetical protein O166_09880 [Pseudogulbenkiania ferrooxidans EGD-HP2]